MQDATGQIWNFSRDNSNGLTKHLKNHLVVQLRNGVVDQISTVDLIEGQGRSIDVWGVHTNELTDVKLITKSPNHWNGKEVGNKHYIFALDGCKTDEPVRGIYNEFLSPKFRDHRKVFEVLGDKTKCDPEEPDQVSGLGFSETKKNSLKTVVTGSDNRTRAYEVMFGG